MILFAILTGIVLLLLALIVAVASVAGAGFVVIFGDVIVCIVFIFILMKAMFFRKKK